MSVKLTIDSDIASLTKWISETQGKQMPSAVRNALNETAFDSMQWWKKNLDKYIDRPTKYTLKSIQYSRAEKDRLVSAVGFASPIFGKPIGKGSAHYMKLQIEGGTRLPEKRAIAVPTRNYKTDKFGNIGKPGKIKALLEKPNYFSGEIRGKAGIFKKSGKKKNKKVEMVIAWEPKAQYRSRFNFGSITKLRINKIFKGIFNKNLNQVLKKKNIQGIRGWI